MSEQNTPFPAYRIFGDLILTSGQIALSPASTPTPGGLKPLSDDFAMQANACIDTLEKLLIDAGSDLSQVLRIECFLSSALYLGEWHAIFVNRFANPRPARTTVIAQTPVNGVHIEIQAIAGRNMTTL